MSDIMKLLRTINVEHLIDKDNPIKIRPYWDESVMAEVLAKLETIKDPERRAIMEMGILKLRMMIAQREDELKEAYKKGLKIGMEQGIKKGVEKARKRIELEKSIEAERRDISK